MKVLQTLRQGLLKMSMKRMTNPSAERNKEPILNVLKRVFKQTPGDVLEIASGTGQHTAYFCPNFSHLIFQPTEFDKSFLGQIRLWCEGFTNVRDPLHVDVRTPYTQWSLKTDKFDYIININMIHISPFECTEGLFKNAGSLLKSGGLMITYGPYSVNGVLEPQSNINFNNMLQRQNSEWGVRDTEALKKCADKNGIKLNEMIDMPANNKCLIWEKI